LFWDADVILPAVILFMVGVFTHNMLMCTSIAVLYVLLISKYQKKFPRGVARNVLHQFGMPYKGYPDGFVRVLRG